MYQIKNNMAYINGQNGKYDGKIHNDNVRYGRNASSNFVDYLSSYNFQNIDLPDISNLSALSQDEFQKKMDAFDTALKNQQLSNAKNLPVQFYYQYSNRNFNVYSLLANSYEEMGKKTEVDVKELNKKIAEENPEDKVDVSVLDLDGNGKIDMAEYSTYTLAEDALDKSETINPSNVDGVITNIGSDRAMVIQLPDFKEKYQTILRGLYTKFNLDVAQEEVIQDSNNLID